MKTNTNFILFIIVFWSLVHVEEVSSQGRPLVNKNKKCLDDSGWLAVNQLVQKPCSLITRWWYYTNDRHICANFGFSWNCVASAMNSGGNTNIVKWDQKNEAGQRFTLKPSDEATGYFRIVNDYGKCISVGQDSKDDGAWIYAWDCNTKENGQLWKWL